jgi:hypothetical protein
VEVFRFDRGEEVIRSYGSDGLRARRVAAGNGQVHVTCLAVERGGVIGTHPATGAQLFLVISGLPRWLLKGPRSACANQRRPNRLGPNGAGHLHHQTALDELPRPTESDGR